MVALGVALGGKAGVHLGHQWDLVVSRNTLTVAPPCNSHASRHQRQYLFVIGVGIFRKPMLQHHKKRWHALGAQPLSPG